MSRSNPPSDLPEKPFDPRLRGRARTIYTVVAVLVVLSLVLGLAGYAVWDYLF